MPGLDDIVRVQSRAWEIVEGCADASRALEAVCASIGRVGSMASLHDPAEGRVAFGGQVGVDPDHLALLAERFSTPETSPQVAAIPRMRSGRLDHYERYISRAALHRTAYYDEFWRPTRIGEAGALIDRAPDGRFALVTIGCHLGRDWLDQDERRVAEAMLRVVARAICTRARFARDRAAAHLDGAAPDAALLLGPQGQPRLANGPAQGLFERRTLVRAAGRVRPGDAAASAAFAERLAMAREGRSAPSLIVADGDRLACLVVEPGPEFRDERSVLLSVRPVRPADWTREAVRAQFELTPREADVVLRLCRGRSTEDIAADTGLARESVRINLKRAFAKTGTRGQAELVQLVLSGRRPP